MTLKKAFIMTICLQTIIMGMNDENNNLENLVRNIGNRINRIKIQNIIDRVEESANESAATNESNITTHAPLSPIFRRSHATFRPTIVYQPNLQQREE